MTNETGKEKRVLIISPGRTGSSVLAHVMAQAGADFGVPSLADWGRDEGAYEHEELIAAAKRMRRAYEIGGDKPRSLLKARLWSYHRGLAKRRFERLIARTGYLKSEELDLFPQLTAKLGYQPVIILNYRDYLGHAVSRFTKQVYASHDWLAQYYVRSLANGILALKAYGGTALRYDDIMSRSETGWADALAAVTGLDAARLVEERNKIVRSDVTQLAPVSVSEETDRAFAAAEQFRNQVVAGKERLKR